MEIATNDTAEVKKDDGPRLGIFDDIPNEEYHRGPGISKSGLDLINRSPAHYIENKRHPRPPTPTLFVGSAAHKLILEPDDFPNEYVLEPRDAPSRPTSRQINAKAPSAATIDAIAYWNQWDAENGGRIILSNKPGKDPHWQPGDWDLIHRMRDSVVAHPIASVLLDPDLGRAERSVYWLDNGCKKLCKCRPDFLNDGHNLAVDLKTTLDASYSGFAKSCASYRYYVQDPWYSDGLQTAGHQVSGFVFVAVEKEPPYAVACYIITPEGRRIGRIQYRRNLDLYAECHRNNEWPAYAPEIRELEIPSWGLIEKIS